MPDEPNKPGAAADEPGDPGAFELDAPAPLMPNPVLHSGPVPVSGPAAMEALAAQAEAHAKAYAARAKAERGEIADDDERDTGDMASGADDGASSTRPLSKLGFPGVRVLTISGAIILFAAAIVNAGATSGLPGESSFWMIIGRALLIFFLGAIHTGTGIGAIAIAALLLRRKAAASPAVPDGVSGWELGAARMFVCVGVFLLVSSVAVPALGWFGIVLMTLAGAAAYWFAAWGLFRLPPRETTTLMLCHLALYALLTLATALAVRIEQGRVPPNARGAAPSAF